MTDMNVEKMFKKIIIEVNVVDMGILSKVLSGQSNLNYHQNRIQLSYDTGYDYCKTKKLKKQQNTFSQNAQNLAA